MTMLSPITEKVFQAQIVDLARLCGWMVYHTFDSRRSQAGFPDLVLVRGAQLIFAEVKTDRGKLSPSQASWIAALRAVGDAVAALDDKNDVNHVGVYVWRPRAWDELTATLSRRPSKRAAAQGALTP